MGSLHNSSLIIFMFRSVAAAWVIVGLIDKLESQKFSKSVPVRIPFNFSELLMSEIRSPMPLIFVWVLVSMEFSSGITSKCSIGALFPGDSEV